MAVETGQPERPSPYVGSSQRKQNGDAFVTGRIAYSGDLSPPGMLHLAVVRSTHAHAAIMRVNAREARGHPEVLDVLTGEEAAELAEPIPHNLDPAGRGETPLSVARARASTA